MNEVEIVEWWHYIMNYWGWFTEDLYLVKSVKWKTFFWKEIEKIVYSISEDCIFLRIMTMKKFKKCVLYKVN